MFGYEDPRAQAWMVLDRVRTTAFIRAIEATVKQGDVVLDIGTGSGVLALTAARCGAKKVYAIERSAMAELAREHVRENNYADVVEIIREDWKQYDPSQWGETPTVVVGEQLGHFAPDEDLHGLFSRAKELFPQARFIPHDYRIVISVAEIPELDSERRALQNVHGLSLGALIKNLYSIPRLAHISANALVSTEGFSDVVHTFDRAPGVYVAQVNVTRNARANAIVAAFVSTLVEGITLSTQVREAPTHWKQLSFPLLDAIPLEAGEHADISIAPVIVSDWSSYRWSIKTPGAQRYVDGTHRCPATDRDDWLRSLGLKVVRGRNASSA